MDSALPQLSTSLLGSADASLLDVQLELLCPRIADEDVRELLSALHEAGEGDTLRDLLADGRLGRWVAENCTAREEEALCAQLRRWLGLAGAGGDDPARLVALEPVPSTRAELLRWARAQGVESWLGRPAVELLPQPLAVTARASLGDICLGLERDGGRSPSLLAPSRSAEEARAHLHGLVAARAALGTRAALHAGSLPEGALGSLARRLRALAHEHPLHALHAWSFVPARPVSVEPETGVCRGALVAHGVAGHGELPTHATVFLSGFEQRALEARCDRCAEPRCVHVAALAARLLDGCLLPDDRLQPALTRLVRVPSWQRFLHALSPTPQPAERTGLGRSELTFALRLEPGGRAALGVLQRRRQSDGRLSKGKLVSAHKLARATSTGDRDQAVLAALTARTRTTAAQYVPVDLMILRALVEHPNVQVEARGPAASEPELEGTSESVHVLEELLHVGLDEHPEGLAIALTLAGAPVDTTPREHDVRYVLHWQAAAARLTFAALTPPLARLRTALSHFRGVLPPESYAQLAPWLSSLRQSASVAAPKVLAGREQPAPRRLLLRITPSLDEGVDVRLAVRALPLAPLWPPGSGPELVHGLLDGVPCSVRRDLAHERALAASLLGALALDQHLSLGSFGYRLESTQDALALLSLAAREQDSLELEWAERARPLRITSTLRTGDLKIGLFKRGDWCALTGGAQQGALRVAVERLLEAARSGERFVPIEGASYVEIEQTLFERLRHAQLCLLPTSRGLLLPSAALPAWDARLGEQIEGGDAETASWLKLARGSEPTDVTRSAPLELALRDYQEQGVAWLLQRSLWAPGVCLADEMGLGKTVQAIALLAERASRGPQLVIAPTSVVDNWLLELARVAPTLRARLYRGAQREEALKQLGAGVVVVTSYDLVLRDRARFDELSFATLVVDEAQVVKNARTLRARAIAGLQADFRVALSGTPVENRLGDLWSLFHLIAPGLLGSWGRFRARFAVPIERYDNHERAAVLRGLVAPFLLRRTKREVASELPARTEVVHLIELSQAEQDLYATALGHARGALGRRSRDPSARTVQLLAELTRLRQLACHPRLVLEDERVGSSKLNTLLVLLQDLLPRGHRVLIFSQFVRHLALVREAIEALGVTTLSLDGSTPAGERANLVARFQRGECSIFLISLKAGGTGLNLTAADYVVHMDPWWNPSAEDQASDRAHRIGQQRPVTVVKLVAQGTIEERVIALHQHKRRLAELVVAEDASAATELDLTALESLLGE